MQAPILVTGAGGHVGSIGLKIVELLRGRSLPVRALVRSLDERSQALARLGAEVVVGDLTDIDAVRRALTGWLQTSLLQHVCIARLS